MIEDDEDKLETMFPLPFWAVLLCAVILLVPGCSQEDQRVCFVKVLGHTTDGFLVEQQSCISAEAFAESQK